MKSEHKVLQGDRHVHVDYVVSPSGFGVPHEHANGATVHEHTAKDLRAQADKNERERG